MSRPITPSTGSRCSQCQCHGISPKTAGTQNSASSVPVQRSHGDPPGRECNQVQPSPPSHSGMKNAVSPRDAAARPRPGAKKANPVVHRVRQRRVGRRVQRGVRSVPCGEGKEDQQRNKQQQHPEKHVQRAISRGRKNNRNWFHGLDAPALLVCSGSCRERDNGADEESQSSLYYPGREGNPRQKRSGGTSVWTPCPSPKHRRRKLAHSP